MPGEEWVWRVAGVEMGWGTGPAHRGPCRLWEGFSIYYGKDLFWVWFSLGNVEKYSYLFASFVKNCQFLHLHMVHNCELKPMRCILKPVSSWKVLQRANAFVLKVSYSLVTLGQERGLEPPVLTGCKLNQGIDNYNLGPISCSPEGVALEAGAQRTGSHMVIGALGKFELQDDSNPFQLAHPGSPENPPCWCRTDLFCLILCLYDTYGDREETFFVISVHINFVLLPHFGSVIKTLVG